MAKIAGTLSRFVARNISINSYLKVSLFNGSPGKIFVRALCSTSDVKSEDGDVGRLQEQLKAMEKQLEEDKKKLLTEVDDYKDRYKRALAEAENVRRRMQKQVGEAKLFGVQGFCKDLLEVADILGTAVQSVPSELLTSATCDPHLKGMHEGLVMTQSQLHKTFDKHGLIAISPSVGDKFDPNQHEAMFVMPAPESGAAKAGDVAAVTKIGYKLHERTLRPALVGVVQS